MVLATANSWAWLWLSVCLGPLAQAGQTLAGPPVAQTELATRARQNLQEAQARYEKAPGEADGAWKLARACFDLADLATNKAQRASLAERGIAVCQQAIERAPDLAPLHYYLGMNLGELAETKGLTALKLVKPMQRAFDRARELDEHLDWAGPDRNLGLLYRDAPAIGSIGSRAKAREHLKRAVELAPSYPENSLNLIEALVKWGDRDTARRQLTALETVWPTARTNFVGITWAASWADWEPRLKKLQKKLGASPKGLNSPRQRN